MNRNQPLESIWMGGTDTLVYDQCDDDIACTTALDGKAFKVKVTGHTYKANSIMYWYDSDGASAYDSGMRKLVAVASNYITLSCDQFTSEDIQDTNYIYPGITFENDWLLHQVELHLNAASATAEDFTISLYKKDSFTTPGTWGTKLYSKDMNAVQDVIWTPENPIMISGYATPGKDYDNFLLFDWANTNDKTWGLKVTYQMM